MLVRVELLLLGGSENWMLEATSFASAKMHRV